MKKIQKIFLFFFLFFVSQKISAFNFSAADFQFGGYFDYDQAIGSLLELETGNLKTGTEAFYTLPFALPEKIPFTKFGISASLDFGTAVNKKSFIDSWWNLSFATGIWFDYSLNEEWIFRPELRYGILCNFVDAPSRNVSGTYVDQLIQPELSVLWEPEFLKDFSLYGGMNFNFIPEQNNLGNYLGFKIGFLYRPGEGIKSAGEIEYEEN